MSNVPNPTPGFRVENSDREDPLASFGSETPPAVVETPPPALVPSPPAARPEFLAKPARPLVRVTERRVVHQPERRLVWLEMGVAVAIGVFIGTAFTRYFDSRTRIASAPPPSAAVSPPAAIATPTPAPEPIAPPVAAPPATATAPPGPSFLESRKSTAKPTVENARATKATSKLVLPNVQPLVENASTTTIIPTTDPPVAPAVEHVSLPAANRPAGEASASKNDAASIQGILDSYRAAYEKLDARATAALWPGVDTRALNRAFGTLSRQDISFDRCDITVDGTHGTARCNGVISYVRRVGDDAPHSRPMAWAFQLDHSSGEWRITNVSAK